jgi:hypothetical protein
LLECEARYNQEHGNINRRDDLYRSPEQADWQRATGLNLSFYNDNWYRFLIHRLIDNCNVSADLLRNKVNFITFNYDVSLEYNLFKGLSAISLFTEADILKFFTGSINRFIHIYGKIRKYPFIDPPVIKFPTVLTERPRPNPQAVEEIKLFQDYKTALDTIYDASTELRTIAPHEKILNEDVTIAKTTLGHAKCIYILGYGFDQNNSKLLELPDILKLTTGSHKVVLFTNFQNVNRVNKDASRVFFGRNDQLQSTDYMILGAGTGNFLLERSTRDVYGALALDFDSPEEDIISC